MRLLPSVSVVVSLGLLASACTDATDATGVRTRLSAPSAALAKSGHRATTYPNSRKYRDAGFHPATASAGSATISTRALLGRSGTTDVEVTTGTFDGGAPSGTLSSVQVKGYDPGGAQLFTSTNNGLSGSTASFPFSGLARGSRVQVKAAVRDVNAKNEVVTVDDVVHLRPDLVALRVDGPPKALVAWPVNFHASIMERQGDLGARASCVLYVDGTAVDRADGIWVDAAGVVACAMTHVFTAAGTRAIEVRVENVSPGDYDDANNSAPGSIDIVPPAEFRGFFLQAHSALNNTWTRFISKLTTLEGIEETWDQTVTVQGPSQFGSMTGLMDRKLTFPVTMHGEMATNGTTVNTLDQTLPASEPAYWFPPGWEASCGTSFGPSTSLWICTFDTGDLAGHSTIQYDWYGWDIRYHSVSYVTYWDPTCANNLCERYIVNDYSQIGPMFTFGTDFRGGLSVQGAGDAVPTAALATVTLSPFSIDYDYSDPGCSTTPVSMSCSESHHHITGVMGFIAFGSWPPYTP